MSEQMNQDEVAETMQPVIVPPYSTPRWVKVFGIATLILILLIGIMLLTGNHGPGRHTPLNHITPTEHGEQHP
jgi:hypothetical protein